MKVPHGCIGCRNCPYFNGGVKSSIDRCMYFDRKLKTVKFSIVQPYMNDASQGRKVRRYPCFALRGLFVDGLAINLDTENKKE